MTNNKKENSGSKSKSKLIFEYFYTIPLSLFISCVFYVYTQKQVFPVNIFDPVFEYLQHIDEYNFQNVIEESPGAHLASQGARAHHPIIILPGFTSSMLELWKGLPGFESHFRKCIWGSSDMLRFIAGDKHAWIEHLKLSQETGQDPPGIKVRAAQGFNAADFILPGYWVWNKILSCLASVGYDYSSLAVAAFDWRLGMDTLEKRDFFFTKLASEIELMRNINKRKVMLLGHSLGGLTGFYFLGWVKNTRGEAWIERNLAGWITIATPMLGAPKAISTLLSGEALETTHTGVLDGMAWEYVFTWKERREIFRTWGSLHGLLPKGGNKIWNPKGNKKGMIEGQIFKNESKEENNSDENTISVQADDIMNIFKHIFPSSCYDRICEAQNSWINPLIHPLPNIPNFKIYNFYGVGKPTEYGYVYNGSGKLSQNTDFTIKTNITDESQNLFKGIYIDDGDGSVPLVSMGYMGIKGWKNTRLNPANIKVVVREYKHNPISKLQDLRGGPETADHADILGNHKMMIDLLKVVCAFEEIDNLIVSDIQERCEEIHA
ncbi:Phospholipid:diacylglycerol acyltransferase [Astathelohania contejeani]|uniref:Phospholipid:diacylglycerol acyltransferase n=1 Tax=Astathelohania contejeani TaxID=164912 RepID=A0ABQ7HXU7_9MICR|nr:Phospholipid:diacylglycerol acyltransferase [Thelohania contejeani]